MFDDQPGGSSLVTARVGSVAGEMGLPRLQELAQPIVGTRGVSAS